MMITSAELSVSIHTCDCSDTHGGVLNVVQKCCSRSFLTIPVALDITSVYTGIAPSSPCLWWDWFEISDGWRHFEHQSNGLICDILTFYLTTFTLETRPHAVEPGASNSQVFHRFLQWFFSQQQQPSSLHLPGDSNRAWQLSCLRECLFCFLKLFPNIRVKVYVCWRAAFLSVVSGNVMT